MTAVALRYCSRGPRDPIVNGVDVRVIDLIDSFLAETKMIVQLYPCKTCMIVFREACSFVAARAIIDIWLINLPLRQ